MNQLIKIDQHTGNYNFNDPNETSTRVRVIAPEYDFNHEFKFPEGGIDVRGLSWVEALEEIVTTKSSYIKDRSASDELEGILDVDRNFIEQKWAEHRIEEIDDEISKLKKERRKLEK